MGKAWSPRIPIVIPGSTNFSIKQSRSYFAAPAIADNFSGFHNVNAEVELAVVVITIGGCCEAAHALQSFRHLECELCDHGIFPLIDFIEGALLSSTPCRVRNAASFPIC